MSKEMTIIRKDLPTEGVKIGGVQFKPNEPQTVDAELGEKLVKNKGFKETKPTQKTDGGGE